MPNSSEQPKLLAAYLTVGEDELKRETVAKRLRERVSALGDISFNLDVFSGETASGADIANACNTLPFASPMRLVEVNSADKLKKADAEAIVAYLASPCETTVLSLVAEKLAKNTRLYKAVAAIGKHAVIDCSPQKRGDLARTVRALGREHGVSLTDRAATRLIELVGENTVRLDGELKRIALAHVGPDSVTDADIERMVARVAEPKPWELANAFASRDVNGCLALLDAMTSASPFQLIATCTTRIRELICAKTLSARGDGGRIAAELKQPDWRVRNLAGWARGYTSAELRHALSSSRDAERAMKSGADPDETFRLWLFDVVSGGPGSAGRPGR